MCTNSTISILYMQQVLQSVHRTDSIYSMRYTVYNAVTWQTDTTRYHTAGYCAETRVTVRARRREGGEMDSSATHTMTPDCRHCVPPRTGVERRPLPHLPHKSGWDRYRISGIWVRGLCSGDSIITHMQYRDFCVPCCVVYAPRVCGMSGSSPCCLCIKAESKSESDHYKQGRIVLWDATQGSDPCPYSWSSGTSRCQLGALPQSKVQLWAIIINHDLSFIGATAGSPGPTARSLSAQDPCAWLSFYCVHHAI